MSKIPLNAAEERIIPLAGDMLVSIMEDAKSRGLTVALDRDEDSYYLGIKDNDKSYGIGMKLVAAFSFADKQIRSGKIGELSQ